MFDNFFKKVKEGIENENKEFNLALVKFINSLNHSVKARKFLHFKVLVPNFLVKNVQRSMYDLLRFQEENLKLVVDNGRVM